jgi:hypothetical protein
VSGCLVSGRVSVSTISGSETRQTVRKALHHFVSRRLKKNISHSVRRRVPVRVCAGCDGLFVLSPCFPLLTQQLHHVPGLMRAWNYVRDSVLTQNALLVAALFSESACVRACVRVCVCVCVCVSGCAVLV